VFFGFKKACLRTPPVASSPFLEMKPDPAQAPLFLGLTPASAALLVIGLTTLVRFFYATWLPILPDETYYLQWAKHLDASYYSKGPAIAYTIAAGTAIFGSHNLGVRFFAVLLSAGTAWQLFLLTRRWFDEVTGLIAVLVTGVVPLYALGAVVMTIDPLSAFFWVWAAYLFTKAVQDDQLIDWLLCGFAVGSGFLAKYLNALELLSFLIFLLIVPAHRRFLSGRGFWLMILVAVICTTPVFWWNAQHGWVSGTQLEHRGQIGVPGPFLIRVSTFLEFIVMQAVVISPWLFLALSLSICISVMKKFKKRDGTLNEGEVFLFILFAPVFLMYAILSWHLRCEPNWPAVSYFSLIVVLASHWRKMLLNSRTAQPFIVIVFMFAWLQMLLMHDTQLLGLPQKADPMERVVGWSEIADHLNDLRGQQHADVLITDGYKEASVFSFYLPDQAFVYTLRHDPPANQYDLWPGFPKEAPHRALWITGQPTTDSLQADFNTITFLEHVVVSYDDKSLREYDIYLCENK
jgi:4-amino-4-deoxy-L-arabinose transferase-like glycosyltransferase